MSFNQQYFFPTIITNITSLNGGIFGTVKATDVYPAVDTTDFTQSPTGTTKPYQILQLINYILNNMGFSVYLPVLAATTSNLTATYDNGLSGVGATLTNSGTKAVFSVDGVSGVLNGRYLVKNQSSQYANGIYILSTVGDASTDWVLTRSQDFNQEANIIDGGIVYVIYGATLANTYWQDTFTPPVVVGTTSIIWTEWSFIPEQFVWTDVTVASINSQVNHGYIADRAATPVQLLLPSSFGIGDTVIVLGNGTGGWSLIANSGQNIQFGSASTSTGGAINSDIRHATIQVRGLVPDTTWIVTNANSNPSYT